MRATVQFESAKADVTLPAHVIDEMHAFRALLARHSQIIWGEHCSECAYPACYSQCSFYSPRADLHCRRFDRGIEAVRANQDLGLTQIQFRQWGKLEGQGPLPLRGLDEIASRMREDAVVSTLIGTRGVPRRLSQGLINRWNQRKAGRAPEEKLAAVASHFIIETFLDPARHAAPIAFTLTLVDAAKEATSLFQTRFDIPPGYGRQLVPVNEIARMMSLDVAFLVQIEPVGAAPPVPIVFGLVEFVAALKGAALAPYPVAPNPKVKTAKCLVWDLDETLWHGILAEDGIEGLSLRPEAAALIKTLDARGILMSVASKNDPEPALAALQHFGLREYFLFPQIGWGPKSQSVRQIAELLDIGADTFVFVDDQPFERAEVARGVPGVLTIDAADVPLLAAHPRFDVPATAEAARRRGMYQTEETRQAVYETSGADYLAFLKDCEIVLDVSPLTPAHLERVYELTQRTNQLNFSGARYDRAELTAMLTTPGRTLVLRCTDRFGDYGIIGFVVANPDAAEIESFFMSCRVQRKRVEHALFQHLLTAWRLTTALRARFRPTEKNAASVRLLESLGFARDGAHFVRPAGAPVPDADIVTVRVMAEVLT
jgi:FkbH-like protein